MSRTSAELKDLVVLYQPSSVLVARLADLLLTAVLLRSLPNPLTVAEVATIRDARPAGPPPTPDTEPLRVERRVSSRGALVIAGQRIHVGIRHAGATLTVEAADTTFRVHDGNQVLTEVARTTTKNIARFKARKPEPPTRRNRRVGSEHHHSPSGKCVDLTNDPSSSRISR
ncbi:hypothetical protein [Micromonospora sp. IBHARD004]|uniref:hypothetical protein n=1 Tax=Micromonospora sp. IBHARD004 TaxID=3457764 RepID=UPI004058E5C4